MYESLRKFINNHTSAAISDDDFEQIKNSFTPKHFRRNQYLLQEGNVCKHIGFVVKGAFRQYSIDHRGTEHIVFLSTENEWAGDRESFLLRTPSKYNVDAIEDTDALLITYEQGNHLINTMPQFSEMLHNMDIANHIAFQARLNAAISFTAEERYLDLVENNAYLLQRFPQTTIASYLGITPETFSRIRKKAIH